MTIASARPADRGRSAGPCRPPRDRRRPWPCGWPRRGTVVVALTAGGLAAFVAVAVPGHLQRRHRRVLAHRRWRRTRPSARCSAGRSPSTTPAASRSGGPARCSPSSSGSWAALTATRLTRGEEEAGRWDLLLAGRMRLGSLVGSSMARPRDGERRGRRRGGAEGCCWRGRPRRGRCCSASAIGGVGLVGAGLGVLAAQVVPERRAASGLAVAVLMAGLLVRMVADGVDALVWAHWVSPFGLLARTAPYSDDRVLPVLVLLVAGARPRGGRGRPVRTARRRRGSGPAAGTSAGRGAGCSARCRPSPSAASAVRCWAGGPAWPPTSC